MTFYDSSVLIDYLNGEDTAAEYVTAHVDERTATSPLVLFEIYQGEVFKAGEADFEAVDHALRWLSIVDETAAIARAAAELQDSLQRRGEPLSARDAYIAGAAKAAGERLVVADEDFAVAGLTDLVDVEII